MTAELSDEELGQAHQVKYVWPWGRPEQHMVRWECVCGWIPSHPIARGKSMSIHHSLRESHFLHLKALKRARDKRSAVPD